MSTDGKFFRGDEVPIEEPGMMVERGDRYMPAHIDLDRILFTEEISENMAAEVLAERILSKPEYEKALGEENGRVDCKKAVVEQFSDFMKQNSDLRTHTSYRGFDEVYEAFRKKI